MPVHNYVISLRTAAERREHIQKEFEAQAVVFEFFNAVEPSQVAMLAKKYHINILHDNLTKGELGCLLSHISLWQKMIDNNWSYLGIFEDDIYLGKDAALLLNSHQWIPNQCGLIKLEAFTERLYLGKTIATIYERAIKPLDETHLGTAGYIINKSTAQAMLDFTREVLRTQAKPLDHIMFEYFLKYNPTLVYQMAPALCIQSDRPHATGAIKSDLEAERRTLTDRKEKIKLSATAKLSRELKRLPSQLHAALFKSNVNFL